jgi:hypothetical protein
MQKIVGMMLIVIGASAVAMAQARTPEIDPTSMTSGLALLSGALLVIRAKTKK